MTQGLKCLPLVELVVTVDLDQGPSDFSGSPGSSAPTNFVRDVSSGMELPRLDSRQSLRLIAESFQSVFKRPARSFRRCSKAFISRVFSSFSAAVSEAFGWRKHCEPNILTLRFQKHRNKPQYDEVYARIPTIASEMHPWSRL